MKKITIAMMAILFAGLIFTGCGEEEELNKSIPSQFEGKILILQAYGNEHSNGSPGGVSHSFVELYNTTNSAIEMDGVKLYFANGSRETGATADMQWASIDLSGKTIPASGSFLILGKKFNDVSGTRYIIDEVHGDDYGDINNDSLSLSNRAFKVVLIEAVGGNENLIGQIQNPFDITGKGRKIDGYIDMVGAANSNDDTLFGYEKTPARCSASEAVRRGSLADTNNNSVDFVAARYAATGNGAFSDEMLEVRHPRNAKDNQQGWNPFRVPGELEGPFVEAGVQDSLAGQLLILQAYGPNAGAAGASHPFVELYNNTNNEINLDGIMLYFADGTRNTSGSNASPGPVATEDGFWKKIALNGTIPAKGSFLVLGPHTSSDGRLQITNNYGDMNESSFVLSNRAYKIAIIRTAAENNLNVQNPFTMDGSSRAAGYIDMVGVANSFGTGHNDDMIYGYETTHIRGSASEAVRRNNLTDTNNNSVDFVSIRYATGGLTNAEVEVRRPRNSTDTASGWNPFAEPEDITVPETETLMILQANTYGNTNGGFPAGLTKSLVELYNNSNEAINLTTGNYYLHIGNATVWTHHIKLEGIVPAKSSFLIVSSNTGEVNNTPIARLPASDFEADFAINNGPFKIAIIRNHATLSVVNPFVEASLNADYVDMLGVGSNGFEGRVFPAGNQSRPRVPRRISLADTDDNSEDFKDVDYRAGNIPFADLFKYWPRNASMGAWNPISGLPQMDPVAP